MAIVKLTKGMVAYVDDCDSERISKYSWCATQSGKTPYAQSRIGQGRHGKREYMHTFLIGKREGFQIDHIDGNGLNNRRTNLRHVTRSQNQWNRNPNQGKRFKGIIYSRGKWIAKIKKYGQRMTIGSFNTEVEAALAYNREAKQMFSQCARFNRCAI